MGWIAEGADKHEGWVAMIVADGRSSSTSSGEGVVLYSPPTAADEAAGYVRRTNGRNAHVVVPWDQVVSWRASCECGWVGPQLPAVADPKHGWRDCPEDLADRVFYPAWTEHVAPFIALDELGEMWEQLHVLEVAIRDKVQQARTAGVSWAQIGREVGLTKQGAQQRWGTVM